MHNGIKKSGNRRLFIGVPYVASAEVTALLAELKDQQEQGASGLRPVVPQNLHLTLEFLGPVPAESVASIEQALENALKGIPAFDLNLCGLGAFRTAIWLGVCESGQLQALVQNVRANMGAVGLSGDDKAFRAHITVARLKPGAKFKLSALLEKYAGKRWGLLAVESVHLIESQTLPEGAVYTSLRAISLSRKAGGRG